MIVLDLSILNQKGTPMFNSDTFANRPAFGIVGRIFISTDTKEFYRDTGTTWELIGGPGSGTITGTGAAGQVTYFTGATSVAGSNNLFWDAANNHLGINTNTPGTALDIHHNQNTILQLNQTTATNDTRIAFQNSGTALWRIGNFYTAGANDFGVFDVVGSLQQLTIVNTTGQTFVGAKTTAAGRLVINSATADAHLQVVGANAPSIRIDNAGSGGTQRFVFGLATATNNFIQGAAAGQFCISTQSSGAMLFGMWQTTNASEVMRISTANNLIVGSSVDNGNRFQVTGAGTFSLSVTAASFIPTSATIPVNGMYLPNTNTIAFSTNTQQKLILDATGNLGLGVFLKSWAVGSTAFEIGNGAIWKSGSRSVDWITNGYYNGTNYIYNLTAAATYYRQFDGSHQFWNAPSGTAGNTITFTQAMTLTATGNLLVGTTTDAGQKLQVNGTSYFNGNVGIGIASATKNLEVSASSALLAVVGTSGSVPQLQLISGGVVNWSLRTNQGAASDFTIYQDSSEHIRIASGGNFGIGVTPTAALDISASTTGRATMRIRSGVAPTTPSDGDIWFDGTNLFMRIGGLTKTFTII